MIDVDRRDTVDSISGLQWDLDINVLLELFVAVVNLHPKRIRLSKRCSYNLLPHHGDVLASCGLVFVERDVGIDR